MKGDVLAFVPRASLLTLANPAPLCNYDGSLLEELSSLSTTSKSASLVALVLYVGAVAERGETSFRDWINSFVGPAPPIKILSDNNQTDKILHHCYAEEVENLVSMANVSDETAQEAITARYDAYERDWRIAQQWMNDFDDIHMDELQFAELYSILVSRTANLGPVYAGRNDRDANVTIPPPRGVIPLHDMFNHPPSDMEHNVDLFMVGDLRKLMPEEEVWRLVGEVFGRVMDEPYGDINYETIGKKLADGVLNSRDALLVARREISPGEELFLSYRNRAKPMVDEKERAWTCLQYGFLPQ
jgi:hypothetical protein